MSSEAESLWGKASDHLQQTLHPDVYSRWIAVIKAIDLSEAALTLEVDNDFYQTWLEENYLPMIEKAVSSVCGRELEIVFAVAAEVARPAITPPPGPKPVAEKTTKARGRVISSPLNPGYVFDKFIVGGSNNFAHAATMAVAQAPAKAYNPLFIYSASGLGKTHLMQAIGHHVVETMNKTVCYVSSEAFTNEYIDALQNRKLVQFRRKYRSVDVLLIDDIHFLAGKERLQEEFFHTFNSLFDAHKQIVLTSDRPASEISGLEQRLVSRFEWGLVTEMDYPDLETRIAILRKKQEQYDKPLPADILNFIAQRIRYNIRRLEGSLIRTVSFASLTGRELTKATVEHLLRDSFDQEKEEVLTFDVIQRKVAEHYDIRLADMTSKQRPQAVAVPRQVAMYLCRSLTNASLQEIGTSFGKTHATVLHASRTIEKKMLSDETLRRAVTNISQKLGKSNSFPNSE